MGLSVLSQWFKLNKVNKSVIPLGQIVTIDIRVNGDMVRGSSRRGLLWTNGAREYATTWSHIYDMESYLGYVSHEPC